MLQIITLPATVWVLLLVAATMRVQGFAFAFVVTSSSSSSSSSLSPSFSADRSRCDTTTTTTTTSSKLTRRLAATSSSSSSSSSRSSSSATDTSSTETTATATATSTSPAAAPAAATAAAASNHTTNDLFQDFVEYLLEKQSSIIAEIEQLEELMHHRNDNASATASSATFSQDTWGIFENADTTSTTNGSGGITRVLQGGHIIEKGACSFTLIQNGILSADRAATIRARQEQQKQQQRQTAEDWSIEAGDAYSAAALSMVLHTRSPFIPTFRSDVRIFLVQPSSSSSAAAAADDDDDNNNNNDDNRSTVAAAWFGGGADLTPYYFDETDIRFFHQMYKDLCDKHSFTDDNNSNHKDSIMQHQHLSYQAMKTACDDYFYLPARSEHRGTGGIFFDNVVVSPQTLAFCKGVADTWMPSWFPIVKKHVNEPYTEQQKQWQLIRRGRYLEFNLLYDRGVKFGLANANPRVEGVMVSAPPLIAYEYKHVIEPGSPEDKLVQVLKKPRDWLGQDDA